MTELRKINAVSVSVFDGPVDGVAGFSLSANWGGEKGDILALTIRSSHINKDALVKLLHVAHDALTGDDRFEIATTERFPR